MNNMERSVLGTAGLASDKRSHWETPDEQNQRVTPNT